MTVSGLPGLILTNARIITLDPLYPHAQLVALGNGEIQSIGRNEDLEKLKGGETQIIDCRGKTVIPGFIDAHMHLTSFAESLVSVNLGPHNGIRSISEIQMRIRTSCRDKPQGTWIRCRGYDEFYLSEKRHPTRWDLDLASSVHPVRLTHRSGHAHVLNSLGLNLVGISKTTPDPEGGIIDRSIATGEPTGLLFGMGDFLSKSIPPLESGQLDRGIEIANRELLSLGITSVQDASSRNDMARWEQFQRWKAYQYLRPRVTMMLGVGAFKGFSKERYPHQVDENQLSLGGVKIMVDEVTGRLNPSQEELNELVGAIHQAGLQAVIHAIEEPAIEAACTAIEYALRQFPRRDHRHRIEHCSVCRPSLARRAAGLRVIVVTQPSFIYYHGERYLNTVSKSQMRHLYPIATLMGKGIQVIGSSDCPVAPPSPMIGMYGAISRRSETGYAVSPKERIAPLEALRMYTEYAANATFEEARKGSITRGKVADLVVVSDDPTTVPSEEVKNITVEMTILDGDVVWDRNGLADDASFGI
jgi:predicted amidohydrolase YtcJ